MFGAVRETHLLLGFVEAIGVVSFCGRSGGHVGRRRHGSRGYGTETACSSCARGGTCAAAIGKPREHHGCSQCRRSCCFDGSCNVLDSRSKVCRGSAVIQRRRRKKSGRALGSAKIHLPTATLILSSYLPQPSHGRLLLFACDFETPRAKHEAKDRVSQQRSRAETHD